MKRLLLALGVSATMALPAVTAAAATPPARTVGPVVVGWWSAANRNPIVPAVAPPDAGPRDLYVAGANAVPAQLPVLGEPGPAAIAGLRFRLPAGASASQLRLQLAGVHPPAVTITACRALRPFAATYAGAWQDAPPYDCSDAGTARLGSDGEVVLDGVDRLRRGADLAVVLVPGPLDRVVVAAPDERTLTVTAPAAGRRPTANELQPLSAPVPTVTPSALPSRPFDTAALSGGRFPVVPRPSVPSSPASPSVAAPAAPAPAAAVLPARPWPMLAATLLLALLAFVPIVRPRRGDVAAGAAGTRGVGRLRSERTGTVPGLT
ncbi:MAG: hypothetical protein WCD35_16590 [Mycobacteriales bacterium]